MSNPRKIEDLIEATNLHDNDLMFASVKNSGNTYVSRNVTLATIANYVRNGMEPVPGGSGFGGYEMIDTTEDGTGVYTAETISQYISDRNKNYLWDLKLGAQGVYDVDVPFVKTLGKDCAIWIYSFVKEGTEQGETQVFLNDNVRLYNLECLKQSGFVQFYAKAGQTVKVIQSRGLFCRIFIIPLASGGKYFFDASDPTKFKRGVLVGTGVTSVSSNWYTYDNDFIERADGSNHIKVTAPYPMLFAGGFILNDTSSGDISTINEKNTLYAGWNGSSGLTSNYVCLKEGDVFETDITSNTGTYWIAYPLLMEDNGSGNGSCSCNCGQNEIYDTSEGNGIFNSIEEYQNSPYNYLFYYTVSRVPENEVVTLEKTVTKDCAVFIYNPGSGGNDEYYEGDPIRTDWGVFINNRRIPTACFQEGNGEVRHFYLKKDQTIKLELRQSQTWNISIIPLISGAKFFIDPSNEVQGGNETINGNKEFTFQRPTLFSFHTNYVTTDARCSTIDGKPVYPIDVRNNWWSHFILNPNQQFIPVTGTSTHIKWYAIPLIENKGCGCSGGSGSGENRTCGYEMIDTTEDETGVYETETEINEYMQNQNKNYLWRFKVGASAPAGISVLEKQVHKDCKVYIQLANNDVANDTQQVYINDVRIYTWPLSIGNVSLGRVLYVKKNQTLKIISTQWTPTVTILPLKSGGEFFLDTNKQDVFKSGFYNPGTNPPTETTGNNFVSNGQFTYTASCPTMVCTTVGGTSNLSDNWQPTLNGKTVHITSPDRGSGLRVFLDKNDTISCAFASNVISYYGIYPLIVG